MTQTFVEFMADFLKEKKAKDVVEIGSDVQLKLALDLSPYCERFYSVNFPEDHERMKGWYEMHQEMGCSNIELLSGNAVQLSDLIPKADIIILKNVLLDLNGEDTALMWKYRRGEMEYTEEQLEELRVRFLQAEEQGYKEFLKVANPGYIIQFGRQEPQEIQGAFRSFLVDELKISPEKIEKKELLYEKNDLWPWEAYIIDNFT